MIWILTLAFLASAITTLAVIASSHRHERWSADHNLSGPQKMHVTVVPRVGGVGIAVGLALGAVALLWHEKRSVGYGPIFLLVACAPAFAMGLVEDFTKAVSPRRRLVATAISACLGIWLLGALVVRLDSPWVDAALAITGVGFGLTLLAVAGVTNSVNIIDGMNGLASMCVSLMMVALAYIAFQVGDRLVAGLALATLGACLGFFMWNYPRGLIFLGDGGAYLLGFLTAELGLMLVARNPQVSPLAPLLMAAYPIFETIFTMYRRKVLRGRPVSLPDGIHLHTLIYRRLMRWAVGTADAAALTKGNSMTSPYLWVLSSIAVVPAAIWWDNTPALLAIFLAFVLVYLRLYWQIVRFKTPGWLSSRWGTAARSEKALR